MRNGKTIRFITALAVLLVAPFVALADGQRGNVNVNVTNATPIPVSGTVTTTGGLTDTQLRATPVPVSGTVTATTGGLTDTQLRASSVPVTGTVVDTQATASNLNAQVVGSVANAATDSGNPVKIGGKYNSTLPTFTDGQRGDLQIGTRGSLGTTLFDFNSANALGTSGINANTINDAATPLLLIKNIGYLKDTTSAYEKAYDIVGAAANSSGIGVAAVEEAGRNYCHISTSTTTTCKSGAGFLHSLSVNNLGTVASTTTVYDNTAASGSIIAVINTLAGQTSYMYDIRFATGLTIVTTGTVAPDITVSYR